MRHQAVLSRSLVLLALAACMTGSSGSSASTAAPSPDPRVGLKGGLFDAGTAFWNMKLVSTTPASEKFKGITNSDLAFTGTYAIQGSYSGYQVWDISDPAKPTLKVGFYCPASQSDVSVFKNLLFVSGEGTSGRLDCGAQGVQDSVSAARLRGLRIFDITDIAHPKYLANVQTCRGSHTHTMVIDPNDAENVYVYISGSAGVRSPSELPGCSKLTPDKDANSALFRIEVIKIPLAHPEQAAIVSSPRIFNDLTAPKRHGEAPEDSIANAKAIAEAKAKNGYVVKLFGSERVLPPRFIDPLLDSIVKARGGTPPATAADSATLHTNLQAMVDKRFGVETPLAPGAVRPGPTQCHDITVYPAIGLAGGACEGYGLLLDIKDVAHPTRIYAVSDSNFSYWHSATFNNDGTKLLFSDEWGGGGQPKCRVFDRHEWGADAIFVIQNDSLRFKNYYKMLAPQTANENCVAHNGSLVPIPGRDVMIQAWYQGGISLFDFTDASRPKEIAFFDRGPVDSTKPAGGGSWSAYWYNGYIVSSEIARGLDILELTTSGFISQNELDAAKSVHLDYFDAQTQPKFVWPSTYALAGAYLDQLERANGLPSGAMKAARNDLDRAQKLPANERQELLNELASKLKADASSSRDGAKVRTLAGVVADLAK